MTIISIDFVNRMSLRLFLFCPRWSREFISRRRPPARNAVEGEPYFVSKIAGRRGRYVDVHVDDPLRRQRVSDRVSVLVRE